MGAIGDMFTNYGQWEIGVMVVDWLLKLGS